FDNETASAVLTKTDGTEGGANVTFTVDLGIVNNSGGAIAFTFTPTGTATNGTDYSTAPATISVANGQQTGSITLTVSDDALLEGPETIIGTISSPTPNLAGAVTIGTAVATATITDNETATATLSKTDGTEGGANVTFTVTLDKQYDGP